MNLQRGLRESNLGSIRALAELAGDRIEIAPAEPEIPGTPILAAGRVVGFLAPTRNAEVFAGLLSQMATLESEKRSVGQEALNRYKELTFLYRYVENLSAGLSVAATANVILDQASSVIQCDEICLILPDPDGYRVCRSGSPMAETLPTIGGAWQRAWTGGNALLLEELGVADIDSCPFLLGQRSFIGAPLKTGPSVVGLLSMTRVQAGAYNSEHLKLATTLGLLSALAISVATYAQEIEAHRQHLEELVALRTQSLVAAMDELAQANSELQRDIEMARDIQQSLIPKSPPLVSGLNVAAHYRAMQRVGGDFYDFRTANNQLAVLMADVSGHGIPAALIVSMVHLAFSFQKEGLDKPDVVFSQMNQILYGNTSHEFVTACYLHCDTAARSLVVGNAGHPPLMIWRKHRQQLIKIRPFGRILGILPEPQFQTERIALQSGDRIFVYTDGASEAANANDELFGEDRLESALRANQDKDAESFVADLIQTLLEWSGGPDRIKDDIALVAIDFQH